MNKLDQESFPKLISVVIPALKYDKYLREALTSLFADESVNFEVIIVIDGPILPIPEWATDSNIVNLFTGVRSGAARALNLGVDRASGEYIARLDADDISLPGRFNAQLKEMNQNPSLVMVGTSAQLIDEKGKVLGDFFVRPYSDLRRQLLSTNPFVHSSVLIRRATLSAVGGYDERCIRMQDYDLILRLALEGDLAIIERPYVQYRIHSEQSSKKLSGFIGLMLRISRRRRNLAASLGVPLAIQVLNDLAFSVAQLLRYAGLRSPRYLQGSR